MKKNEQKTLIKQETINKCYVVWNHRKRGTWEEQPMVIIYGKTHQEKPFHKQKPVEILTVQQMRRKHGINLIERRE